MIGEEGQATYPMLYLRRTSWLSRLRTSKCLNNLASQRCTCEASVGVCVEVSHESVVPGAFGKAAGSVGVRIWSYASSRDDSCEGQKEENDWACVLRHHINNIFSLVSHDPQSEGNMSKYSGNYHESCSKISVKSELLLCLGAHHSGFLILSNSSLKEISLSLQRNHFHPVKGILASPYLLSA